jgi:hypothetical protein
VAQAGWKGFPADQPLFQAGDVAASFQRLLHQDAQKAGCAHVGHRTQLCDGLQLLFSLAGARREHGATHGMRTGLHDESAGRHVVAERVVHQITLRKPAANMARAARQ